LFLSKNYLLKIYRGLFATIRNSFLLLQQPFYLIKKEFVRESDTKSSHFISWKQFFWVASFSNFLDGKISHNKYSFRLPLTIWPGHLWPVFFIYWNFGFQVEVNLWGRRQTMSEFEKSILNLIKNQAPHHHRKVLLFFVPKSPSIVKGVLGLLIIMAR